MKKFHSIAIRQDDHVVETGDALWLLARDHAQFSCLPKGTVDDPIQLRFEVELDNRDGS